MSYSISAPYFALKTQNGNIPIPNIDEIFDTTSFETSAIENIINNYSDIEQYWHMTYAKAAPYVNQGKTVLYTFPENTYVKDFYIIVTDNGDWRGYTRLEVECGFEGYGNNEIFGFRRNVIDYTELFCSFYIVPVTVYTENNVEYLALNAIWYNDSVHSYLYDSTYGYGHSEAWFQHIFDNIVPPITYNWQSVSHLTGNNGQFNMQLSQLDASIIGDGSTAASSTDPEKYSLSNQSSIYNMLVNIANNEETTIAYCGGNYCTATRRFVAGTAYDLIYFTLKFYFRSDTLIYTSPEINVRADHNNDRLFSMIFDSENEIAALDLITTIEGVNGIFYNNSALPSDEQMRALYIWLQDNGETHTGPYDSGTTDNGGDPSTPRPQDHITPSTLPTKGGLNTGLFTLYLPTDAQMSQIAAFLWSDNVLDNFKKYFNNFADNILACYSLPYTPANLSTKAFKVGNMVSDTITNVAYSQIRCFDIDMGSVTVKKLWDSYLDFAPFTKAEIYLPFIGLHSLDIDEIMCPTRLDGSVPDRLGTVLSLTYRLDILTGVVVAMLKVRVYTASGGYTDEIRYQFTGKVGYSIPLTGQTYANMAQGIVTALAGVATTIATGGLTAPMTAAAAVVGTVQASKPNVERIGNISGDASMLASNVPYLILTSPNKPELIGQDKFTGFPSYKSGKLSEFSGYTEVLDAHVEGMNATDTEKEMILNMLKGGVII